jgi:predicted aspartyl protease
MGRTVAKLKVTNAYDAQKAAEGLMPQGAVRSVEVEAMVGTGATYVCLPRRDIEKLGLPFLRNVEIRTANGNATRRIFEGASTELNGRSFPMGVMENDEDTPPLIGYLLLEALDLVVDSKSQQVIPNPAHDGKWVADLY